MCLSALGGLTFFQNRGRRLELTSPYIDFLVVKLPRDIAPHSSAYTFVRHLFSLFMLSLAFGLNSKKNLSSTSPMTWAPSFQISQCYVPYEQRKIHK